MNKKYYLLLVLGNFSIVGFSQVGINTIEPLTDLEIVKTNDNEIAPGLLITRLTYNELNNSSDLYTSSLKATQVYITETIANPTGKLKNIVSEGFYYFDGEFWQQIIKEPWMVANTITQATGNNEDIYQMGKVGLGTNNPQYNLDIEGTARLSPNIASNVPNKIITDHSPVYVDRETGALSITPTGFASSVGGLRPTSAGNFVIKKFDKTNNILRVNFVIHVDNSNEINNQNTTAYTYGDFTIVGTGNASLCKIVEYNFRGADGQPKQNLNINAEKTEISWSMNASLEGAGTSNLGIMKINIVYQDDHAELVLTVPQPVFSYFFDTLGGT